MKKLLFLVLIMLPLSASAHDIEVKNARGVTIYYNYVNDSTELEVTYRGGDANYYFYKYTGKVVIPKEVTYMNRTRKVTAIGKNAFYDCKDLTSVTIPSSVTSIGDYAFPECNRLTSITIPSSVTSIGEDVFCGCTGLTSVTIPEGVTTIRRGTFYCCSGLTSVTIPSTVTSIENGAFAECTALSSVTIPSTVTSIGVEAFCASGLTSVTIPSSVTTIRTGSFHACARLTSVTIPSSVTSIGIRAFRGCKKLADVYCYAETLPRTDNEYDGKDIFYASFIESSTLHVPASAIEAYRTTEPWSKFGKIVALNDEDAVSEVKAVPVLIQADGNGLMVDGAQAGTPIVVYDLSGRIIGQAMANDGATRVDVTGDEKVVVVKVGKRCVKVAK